ncbi:YicC/YloC family endoribonuclease [Roseomonas genomospecies 6]|uniref:YicC family protein n=1 Tax=Roseomonas genomospecies 6 TaxID=214106 RepID=A0A9W7TZ95_9PROT|nr:YicC/YloC family endoribonuclease [Roseomonas genomospecies 6]KAA0682301.1 YicC family protein [Roseomonas genomospecies 6]
MTGFARVDGHADGYGWTFEVKSVNGRNLDIRCRQPAGFDTLEAAARAEIPKRLARGSVNLNLTVTRSQSVSQLRINRELLAQVLELAREIEGAGAAPPRLDSLLAVRGIIEPVEEDEGEARERVEAALKADLTRLIGELVTARLSEGARLVTVLNGHLDEIERLITAASACASTQPDALRERLRNQVAALLDAAPALPEERLAQEAAILIAKADVREEMDRLRAHIQAARDMLAEGGAIGRRFDFLCQEFNREANTLCSKSADVELTRIGLSLKASIEQLREQVQNIE